MTKEYEATNPDKRCANHNRNEKLGATVGVRFMLTSVCCKGDYCDNLYYDNGTSQINALSAIWILVTSFLTFAFYQ